MMEVPFDTLLGRTLINIFGAHAGNDAITFTDDLGAEWRMEHHQDCCESVALEEVHGDVADLLNSPILRAEASSNEDDPPEHADSFTWTFYKLATIKGEVVLRWLGESNGYYSESVEFHQTRFTWRDVGERALTGNPLPEQYHPKVSSQGVTK